MAQWFRRKRFGYGWTPVTWEGWVVLAIFVAGVIAVATRMRELGQVKGAVLIAALTAVLVAIASATGEKDTGR